MDESREVLFAAAGTQDILGTDDLSGKKSLLAGAHDVDTEVAFMIIGTTTSMTYELLAGSRTISRGQVSTGGTIGVQPTPTTAAVKTAVVLAGEELTMPITSTTGTPSCMVTIERSE